MQMPVRRFLDTNVLIYAFAASDPRAPVAEQLLLDGGVVSVQVLNEFASVSSRKLGVDWPEIGKRVQLVKSLLDPAISLTEAIHDAARNIARTRKLGFYDASIVAAAHSGKCDELVSEDFQAGVKFGNLVVKNPFATP